MSRLDPSSFTTDDLPDMSGARAIVTGGNSGIGFHTARALSGVGAEVTIACRDLDKARAAASQMSGNVQVAELDLASLASVGSFASDWSGQLDLLVDNAGVMAPPTYRETADGFELQFGTNHLGHAALTAQLLPALLAAPAPRVVVVSSTAHHRGDASVVQGNQGGPYSAVHAYGNSKLANLLFAFELQRRSDAADVPLTVTACHPGVANTGLATSPDGLGARRLVRLVAPVVGRALMQSSAAGADATLWAATYAEPGSYVGPTRFAESRGPLGPANISDHALDEQLAARLWDVTQEATGAPFVWS